MGPRGDAAHLLRIAGLFLSGLVVFAVLRAALIPEGFGVYGHYRAGAIDDNRQDELVHGGRAACTACHAAQATQLAGGRHTGVGCEACHGASGRHARDPQKTAATRPDGRARCLRCHEHLVSRPASFPQVAPAEHAPDGACIDCHTAHDPGL